MSHEHPPTPTPAHEHPPTPPASSGAPEHPPRTHHPEDGAAARVGEVRSALHAEAGEHDHHSEEGEHSEHSHGHSKPHIETRKPKEALTHMWKGRGGFLWGGGKVATILAAVWVFFSSFDLVSIDRVSGKGGGGGGGGSSHKEDHGHGGGHGGGGHH